MATSAQSGAESMPEGVVGKSHGHGDLLYQAMTIAAIVVVLVSVWVF